MYRDKKILTVIPARGGSKGLINKNITPLLGRPLIGWAIAQAKCSEYHDRMIVSTEDRRIAEVAKECGAEVPFVRPMELAQDSSATADVLLHALDWFEDRGEVFDYLALVEATSPLRRKDDIDNAITKLIDNCEIADSLVCLGEIGWQHPSVSKRICKDKFVRPYDQDKTESVIRRQDFSKTYLPYGVVYISRVDSFREHRTFYQEKTLAIFLDKWQCYEVDDRWDILCIERIMEETGFDAEQIFAVEGA